MSDGSTLFDDHFVGHEIVWSPRMIRIHQELAQNAAASRVIRKLSEAKIHAVSGRRPEAKNLIQEIWDGDVLAKFTEEESYQFEITALVLGMPRLVESSLNRRFRTDINFEWRLTDDNTPPELAYCRICDARKLELIVSPRIFKVDDTEFFVRRLLYTLPVFVRYLNKFEPISGKTAICLADRGRPGYLSYCDNTDEAILIPDAVFLSSMGYQRYIKHFQDNPVPWSARRPLIFWRGSTTGASVRWMDLPRVKLCRIAGSSQNAEHFDVGISEIVQRPEQEIADIRHSGLLRDRVPETSMNMYRYHIDIDGNTNSWPGLFIKLLSGSPVLKVASTGHFRQWYYGKLNPWVHYVPVQSDMSDLEEKSLWLMSHDDIAQNIGKAGRDLALELKYETELDHAAALVPSAVVASTYRAGFPGSSERMSDHNRGGVSPDDIVWCYRTMLGRDPESEGVLFPAYQSWRELVQTFLNSDEYQHRIRRAAAAADRIAAAAAQPNDGNRT